MVDEHAQAPHPPTMGRDSIASVATTDVADFDVPPPLPDIRDSVASDEPDFDVPPSFMTTDAPVAEDAVMAPPMAFSDVASGVWDVGNLDDFQLSVSQVQFDGWCSFHIYFG